MANVVIQPRSSDDYMREEDIREDIARMQLVCGNHPRSCSCAFCESVRSFQFMLRMQHPVIHRPNCGDCFHMRAGPPLPPQQAGVPR